MTYDTKLKMLGMREKVLRNKLKLTLLYKMLTPDSCYHHYFYQGAMRLEKSDLHRYVECI